MNEIYQLNAEDARAIAKEAREKREDIVVNWILNGVKSRAELGDYELDFDTEDMLDFEVDEEVSNIMWKIRRLGYHVSCLEDTIYRVSWRSE